jgi:hypothetical protein
MRLEKLRSCTKKVLADMARAQGIPGWHAMRKDQLVKALAAVRNGGAKKPARRTPRAAKRPVSAERSLTANHKHSPAAASSPSASAERRRDELPSKSLVSVGPRALPNGYGKDRIVLLVRDPYWLHAYWEITPTAVTRAEAALREEWHGSKPILRLLDVTSEDTTASSESHVRDIDIHGEANNWYIDVSNPPRSFRVDIGYLTRRGRFYALAHSNVVSTPRAGVSDVIDENWVSVQDQFEKIYAMSGGFDPGASSLELKQLFEERLRRPMGSAAISSFGSEALVRARQREFWFRLDAELIVYGSTQPTARVTLQGKPVQLRPDGSFTMRFSLPDKRLIIPATAASADGVEERTIVLAVERNTKELEPMVRETND